MVQGMRDYFAEIMVLLDWNFKMGLATKGAHLVLELFRHFLPEEVLFSRSLVDVPDESCIVLWRGGS